MADIWLRSTTGSDANAGTDKGSPKATLASALTAAGAGGNVWVSSVHAGSTAASITLASPGTAASPTRITCVPDWGAATGTAPPTSRTTGATVTTTGNTTITMEGFADCDGVVFSAGDGNSSAAGIKVSNNTAAAGWQFFNCSLRTASTATSLRFHFGASSSSVDSYVLLDNTTLHFGATGQYVICRGSPVVWRNTSSALGGTVPTTLFGASTVAPANVRIHGVDLSAVTGTLVEISAMPSRFVFENCRLGAGVVISSGSSGPGQTQVEAVHCDSADTNYRFYSHRYEGQEFSETTIVRSGGFSNGTTSQSRRILSTSGCSFLRPFNGEWIYFWSETVGSSVSVTIETVNDGLTLKDNELWSTVEFLGNGSFPISSFATNRAADIFATAANVATSSESWTTTGLTSPVKQKSTVTFTPQEKGWYRTRVSMGRASTTLYYCPKISGTSGRQYQLFNGIVNEGASGGMLVHTGMSGGMRG